MKKCLLAAIVAVVVFVGMVGCSVNPVTMDGNRPGENPPQPIKKATDAPADQFTSRYKVIIYPGSEANFNSNPKLTLQEYNVLVQFDLYCAKQAGEMEGELKEMLKQGSKYGAFEGVLGAIGYRWGFGSLVHPADYLKGIGMTAFGGGLASGQVTFEMAVAVLQGYCVTGMVYKADELEGKLKRLWIVPLYTGGARLPEVSDRPGPDYPNARNVPMPPHP